MSVKIMGLVWDLDNSIIDREEKYILLAYADHADHKGCNVYPAISTIAQKTGYKERATQMITRSLEQKGFLVQDGHGPKGTNKWRIPLDKGGANIAPAKNAGVQKTTKGGAKRKGKGVQPNAPEPSEPSLDPSLIIKLDLFKGYFGKFISEKEMDQWTTLYDKYGRVRADELASWAFRKEIHFANRPSLLDSLETAAKKWREKPAHTNGNGHVNLTSLIDEYRQELADEQV